MAIVITAFPQNLKSFAEEVIQAVKSIFVVEQGDDGSINVVEKPVEQVPLWISGGGTTTSDTDEVLAQKLGYTFSFPGSIKHYPLAYRALGISLAKPVDYNTGSLLDDTIKKAVSDDNAFKDLSQYDPVRFITGYYGHNGYNMNYASPILAIYIVPRRFDPDDYRQSKNLTSEPVQIDGLTGYWVSYPLATYKHDDAGKRDMSKPPISIKNANHLDWGTDSFSYYLCFMNETFTKDEAVELAQAFYEAQPK